MEPLEAVILPDVPSALRAIPNLPKLAAAYALDQQKLDLFSQTLTDDATPNQPPWRFDARHAALLRELRAPAVYRAKLKPPLVHPAEARNRHAARRLDRHGKSAASNLPAARRALEALEPSRVAAVLLCVEPRRAAASGSFSESAREEDGPALAAPAAAALVNPDCDEAVLEPPPEAAAAAAALPYPHLCGAPLGVLSAAAAPGQSTTMSTLAPEPDSTELSLMALRGDAYAREVAEEMGELPSFVIRAAEPARAAGFEEPLARSAKLLSPSAPAHAGATAVQLERRERARLRQLELRAAEASRQRQQREPLPLDDALPSRHELPWAGNWVRLSAAQQARAQPRATVKPTERTTFGSAPRTSASMRFPHQAGGKSTVAPRATDLGAPVVTAGSFLPLRLRAVNEAPRPRH